MTEGFWGFMVALVPTIATVVAALLGWAKFNQTNAKVENGNDKTDEVHKLLNSQLAEWKTAFAEQNAQAMALHKKSMEDAITLVKTEAKAENDSRQAEFDRRLAVLESTIRVQNAAKLGEMKGRES